MSETTNSTPSNPNQILEAKKVNINMLFTDYWFRVPTYQRSYVWGEEQVTDLVDDLVDALKENPNKEYFLGSLVLQKFQEKRIFPVFY